MNGWKEKNLVLTGKDAKKFFDKINNPVKVSLEEKKMIFESNKKLKSIYVECKSEA